MVKSRIGKGVRFAIGSSIAVLGATAAYAVALTTSSLASNTYTDKFITIDIDGAASIDRPGSTPRNLTFKLSGNNQRAELRRQEQSIGARTITGKIKVTDFTGDKISVIQALNINNLGARSGAATPIAQLAIRKTSTPNTYEFYIVQASNQPACTALGTLSVGSTKEISLTYQNGQVPVFKSGTAQCFNGDPLDAKIHNSPGNYYYYGKIGAYHTSSGTGPATIQWTDINDGG